jgi:hypothetical protein
MLLLLARENMILMRVGIFILALELSRVLGRELIHGLIRALAVGLILMKQ